MRKSERGGVNETMIRKFGAAVVGGHQATAKRLLKLMNAVEYLIALDRLRAGDEAKQLPPWLRRV